jgi:hypothetical protein
MSAVFVLIEPEVSTPEGVRAAFGRVEANPSARALLVDCSGGELVKGAVPGLIAGWEAGGLVLPFLADERYCGGFVGTSRHLGDARVVVQAVGAPALGLAAQAAVASLLLEADVVVRCAPAVAAVLTPLLGSPVQACEVLLNRPTGWIWGGFRATAVASRPGPYQALIEELVFASAASGRLGVVIEPELSDHSTDAADDEGVLATRAARAALVAAGLQVAEGGCAELGPVARAAEARAEAATLRWLMERNRLFNLGARARWVPTDSTP